MTTYYLNTAPSSAGYNYYYAPYPAPSSAPSTSTVASSRASKRSRPSAAAAINPSSFAECYARCYGAPTPKQTRPPLRTVSSAPPQMERGYASTHRCYDAPQSSVATAPAPPSSKHASRSRSSSTLRAPRQSFDEKPASAKHVHFADQHPRPPLKAHHTWSAGDRGAPAVFHAQNQPEHTTVPAVPLELHPLLAHSTRHRAAISYDAALPPSPHALLDRKTRAPLPAPTLSAAATTPALPTNARLVLTSPKLPWAVVVQPSRSHGTSPRRTPITNLDVLAAVHASLARPCSSAEWAALGAGSSAQRRVRRAFERRCARAGGWEGGVRRIDWLGGKTRLVGVEVERGAPAAVGVTGTLVFASPKE